MFALQRVRTEGRELFVLEAKPGRTLHFEVVWQFEDRRTPKGTLLTRRVISICVEGDLPMLTKMHLAMALEERRYVAAQLIVEENLKCLRFTP